MRARRLLEQRPLARLAHGELLAVVVRQRDSLRTARLSGAAERAAATGGDVHELTNVLLNHNGAPSETAEAGPACFNRAIAKRRVNEG